MSGKVCGGKRRQPHLAGLRALTCFFAAPAAAEIVHDYAPVLYDTTTPDRLYLNGPITDARAPVRLNQALARFPEADTLVLASGGGHVYLALPMAYTVRAAGLKTHIAEGQACESACAYLFFAGTERTADGPLGVHQLSVADNSLGTEQIALADIVTAYDAFGVPNVVLSRMLATPPEGMYQFSPEEMAGLRMLGNVPASPGRGSERQAWEADFFLDLPTGYAADNMVTAPCPEEDLRHGHCEEVWGIVIDNKGDRRTLAWNVSDWNDLNTAAIGQGLDVELDDGFLPNGAFADTRNLFLFNQERILQIDGFTRGPGKIMTTDIPLATLDEGDLFSIREYGIYDVDYSKTLDAIAIATQSDLFLFRENASLSRQQGWPPSTRTGLCYEDFGEYAWHDIQFSETGKTMVVGYSIWTLVYRAAGPGALGEATGGHWTECDWGELSAAHTPLFYKPFLDLSRSGRLVAIADEDRANGTRTAKNDFVLGVYDTQQAALLGNGTEEQEPWSRAASDMDDHPSLVQNLYGHETPVSRAAFAPGETMVYSLTEAGVLKICSLPEGRLVHALPDLNGAPIDDAEFVKDTGCLVVSAKGRNAVFLDPFKGEIVQEFPAPSGKFMLDEANELLFTYSFGERPIRAWEGSGHDCRP